MKKRISGSRGKIAKMITEQALIRYSKINWKRVWPLTSRECQTLKF